MGTFALDSSTVADHILWLRHSRNLSPTTSMHVIKLTYLAHGWSLGWDSKPLIDEPIEAWSYGPVIPSLYHRYKSFGADQIKVVLTDRSVLFGKEQLETVEFVVGAYRKYTALQLSDLTHEKDSPWDITRRNHGIGSIIPNNLIQEYYVKQVEEVIY